MRVYFVFCVISVGVVNTQEYNYNGPQISQPQRLYNAPTIAAEPANNLNQGYNYAAPSHLYDAPQLVPPRLNQGYNYKAPSQLYDAPQSNQGYNYKAPSHLYDAPQPLPAQPGYDYNPSEESQYVPTLERMPTSELPGHGYNYKAPTPSQLYSPPIATSEPVQEQNTKYLPPEPRTTTSPTIPTLAEKYLPANEEPPYPSQLSTHLAEIKGTNEAGPYPPKSYNYKPNQPAAVSITKHFFIPQSKNQSTSQGYNYNPPSRTHYRVIFIRTPTPENNQFPEQQQYVEEEKTVIYVLNQQPKGQKYLPPPNPVPTTLQTKPEVFYLNYKTPEEAAQAQQQIQAQYDALGGGPAQIVDGYARPLDKSYIPPSPALYPETF